MSEKWVLSPLFVVLLPLAGGLSSPVSAATLSLDRALALADENHPLLAAGSARIESARAGIVTARAYPNPEATAMAGGQTYRVPGNVSGSVQSFGFTQPLELGVLRASRIQMAERGRDSAELLRSGARLAVLSGVRRAFFAVLRKQGEIGILSENVRLVQELRQRIQVRVDVGEAGRLELIRADSEVITARSSLNSARLRQIAELAQFRAAVGTALDPVLALEGQIEPAVALQPLEQVVREAIEGHPAIRLARAEVKRAQARVTFENASRRPQPSIRVEIDRPPDTPTFRAGLAVPLPFWNRREGPVAEAVAQLREANALLQSREIEIGAAIEGAYRRYEAAGQQLAAFESGLLLEAEAAVRIAETAYRLGERGILEVLDAQRTLRTVRLDFLNAQFDRQAALIDLDELRGFDLRRQP